MLASKKSNVKQSFIREPRLIYNTSEYIKFKNKTPTFHSIISESLSGSFMIAAAAARSGNCMSEKR